MTLFISEFVFPALFAVLAFGSGLLLERATGRPLPTVLLMPVGLAVKDANGVPVLNLCQVPTDDAVIRVFESQGPDETRRRFEVVQGPAPSGALLAVEAK